MCRDVKPRLLMSFKQVQYLQYYIKQMRLVDGVIPLPSSESLLFGQDIRDLEPFECNDPALTKKALSRAHQLHKKQDAARNPPAVTVPVNETTTADANGLATSLASEEERRAKEKQAEMLAQVLAEQIAEQQAELAKRKEQEEKRRAAAEEERKKRIRENGDADPSTAVLGTGKSTL